MSCSSNHHLLTVVDPGNHCANTFLLTITKWLSSILSVHLTAELSRKQFND